MSKDIQIQIRAMELTIQQWTHVRGSPKTMTIGDAYDKVVKENDTKGMLPVASLDYNKNSFLCNITHDSNLSNCLECPMYGYWNGLGAEYPMHPLGGECTVPESMVFVYENSIPSVGVNPGVDNLFSIHSILAALRDRLKNLKISPSKQIVLNAIPTKGLLYVTADQTSHLYLGLGAIMDHLRTTTTVLPSNESFTSWCNSITSHTTDGAMLIMDVGSMNTSLFEDTAPVSFEIGDILKNNIAGLLKAVDPDKPLVVIGEVVGKSNTSHSPSGVHMHVHTLGGDICLSLIEHEDE